MSLYNFKNLDYEDDVIEALQLCERRPSKCDAVLKCDDGQIYLSKISLVIWSKFWKNLFCDFDNGLETVLLLPGFDKESVLEAIVFLSTGEITTEYCPRSIQKVIYFVQALIPDMDILSFEIERIFQDSGEATNSEDFEEATDSDNKSNESYSNEFEGVEIGKNKESRHSCKYCLKFFVRKATLDRHIINIHSRKEQFGCSKCDKKFSSKDGLQSHLKSHKEDFSNQNPCPHPQCGKVYKNESDLFKHCRITGHTPPKNDKIQPDKRFTQCEICHK